MGMYQFFYKIKLFEYKIMHKDSMRLQIDNYRKKGAVIGENVRAFSPITAAEPYLLTIGNDVTISYGVVFLTHDNSVIKCKEKIGTDLVGRITIGNNCFIGCNTVFLPGTELADNIVVGAGSIVTKSFKESDVVIAGNPAKVIATTEDFFRKNKSYVFDFAPDNQRLSFQQRKELILSNDSKLLRK